MKAINSSVEPKSAHDRLLAAAEALFYEEGLNTVGIERVIERAGVAKASLYSNFGSKDELIRSYLATRQEGRQARLQAKLSQYQLPRDKMLGVFDYLDELLGQPSFRGCAFMRAGNESKPGSSVREVCDDARRWMLRLFTDLAREAGAREPEALAQQFVILYDGALISAQMDGNAAAAVQARAMASGLLDAALSR